MTIFLVDQSNQAAIEIIKKMSKAKDGEFVFVTNEEFKSYRKGIIKVVFSDKRIGGTFK